jgi:hypothetical protein
VPRVCGGAVRIEDFDGELIPVLAPEDITMFKIFFNRPNDWADIENVLAVQGRRFDLDYVLGWLERTIGPGDDRIEQLKAGQPSMGAYRPHRLR